MPKFKSILKPEGTVMGGIATAGAVWAIYSMNIGSVSSAHASDANHGALESSRKKAGYIAFIFVSAMTLLTRDSNIGLLGYGSIVAMEINTRHAIMVNPGNGQMQPPAANPYAPAGGDNVTQMSASAGANAPGTGYVGVPGY